MKGDCIRRVAHCICGAQDIAIVEDDDGKPVIGMHADPALGGEPCQFVGAPASVLEKAQAAVAQAQAEPPPDPNAMPIPKPHHRAHKPEKE